MLNAIITANDQTAIIEFPIDQFDLYKQLGQIGIQKGPHKIPLTDDEDAEIQVKLYADNDFGNHVIRLFHERDTLDDVHTAVGAIDIRPWNIPTYKTKEWNSGTVWYEDEYPSLLFAKDGEIYDIEGIRHIAIGGAYSVDMFYRLARGYGWWADEQPSSEIMQYVEQQLKENKIDVVLSHTCPFKYEPVEVFLPGIDQSTVDTTTEKWLEKIEETIDYIAWYCGHWHINKRIDKMHFLFHKFESSEAIKDELERKINNG